MPDFLENPSALTKDKLKSELLAHNVPLPTGEQRKDVYVQLYLQHLTARNRGKSRDFSSDEEREATPARGRTPRKATKKTEKLKPEERDVSDVTGLSNEDLKEELIKYGLNPGPIMGSTRKVYEKRLLKLKEQGLEVLRPSAVSSTAEETKQNGNTDSDQYSDDDDPEIILKLEKREPLKGSLKAQANLRQMRVEQNQTFSVGLSLFHIGSPTLKLWLFGLLASWKVTFLGGLVHFSVLWLYFKIICNICDT